MSATSIIMLSVAVLIAGIITGLIISILYYPLWEIKRLIKTQRKSGYDYGEWNHFKELVDHHFRDIVKPNCETLYSSTFIRKKEGPYVLEMPPFNAYFSFAFLGPNTDVLGYFTNRDQEENESGSILISFPGQEIPETDLKILQLETSVCWVIGRFALNNEHNVMNVNKIQDSIKLTRLKDYENDHRKKN